MCLNVFSFLKTFWKTWALDQSFHWSSPIHCLLRCLMILARNLPSIFKQIIRLVLPCLGEPFVHCSLQSTDLNERLNLTLTESLQTINTLKKASSYKSSQFFSGRDLSNLWKLCCRHCRLRLVLASNLAKPETKAARKIYSA